MNTINSAKLAQCPHCYSVFAASNEEMQLALGAVRCSDCMKIFNANYNLIDSPSKATLTPLARTSSYPQKPKEEEEQQPSAIPTLHDHHQNQWSVTNQDSPEDSLEDPLKSESVQAIIKSKLRGVNPSIFAGLFLLLTTLFIGGWLFAGKNTTSHYEFSEINLTLSNDPKKLDVHFKLTNISQHNLPFPSLYIELLNLSSQPVSSEQINAQEINERIAELEAGISYNLSVSVNRPTTFVQSARIQIQLDDSKL